MAIIMTSEDAGVTRGRSPLRFLASVPPALWTLVALIIFWEIYVQVMKTPVYILPAPSRIVQEFVEYWPRLLVNAGVTLSEVSRIHTRG